MIESSLQGPVSIRRRMFPIVMVLMVSVVSLGVASPALAKLPAGDFGVFSQCPRFGTGVNLCLYTRAIGGEVTLGREIVPIVNTITIQGGIDESEEPPFAETFVGALDGETISKTPQRVPGGLSGLVKCGEISGSLERRACESVFGNGMTSVTATTELARPASEITINTGNLENQEGTALSLPVKVHLTNPFLGSECYIGSSSNPLTLSFTTGTTSPPPPNKPISGKVGLIGAKDEFEFISISRNMLVDNSFSAPAATGCGGMYSFLIDRIIDRKIGLPSAAGSNTMILVSALDEATTVGVIASEE